jgi:hypothetical protein
MNPALTILSSNVNNSPSTIIMAFASLKDITSRKKKLKEEGQMRKQFERLVDDDHQSFDRLVGIIEEGGSSEFSQSSIYSEPSDEMQELDEFLLPPPPFAHESMSTNIVSSIQSPAKCIQLIQSPESSLSTLEISLASLEGLEVPANDLSRPFLVAGITTAPTTQVASRRQPRSKIVRESRVLVTTEKKRNKKSKRQEKSVSQVISEIEQNMIPRDRRACLLNSKTKTTMAQWKLPGPAFDSPRRHSPQTTLPANSLLRIKLNSTLRTTS